MELDKVMGAQNPRRRLAIIPARGGSKRMPDKNIRDFAGRPIIAYSLDAARASNLFDTIHVSTDSERIAALTGSLGFSVDFMRDSALADDHTGLLPVAEWTVRQYLERGALFDDVCLLMPCAPLIEGSDLVAAMTAYGGSGYKPLMAVSAYPAPPQQALRRDSDGRLTPKSEPDFKSRSQDLEPLVYDSGTFLIMPGERLMKAPPLAVGDFFAFEIPREKAIDINETDDFDLALLLYHGLRAQRQAGGS